MPRRSRSPRRRSRARRSGEAHRRPCGSARRLGARRRTRGNRSSLDSSSFNYSNLVDGPPFAPAPLFLKKGRLSSFRLVDRTSSDAPGRLGAHLFLGVGRTPCRWELSRLLNSIRGGQAAKAKRELAGTGVPVVVLGAGLKGSLRESMGQA